MDRKLFLKQSTLSLGTIIGIPSILSRCNQKSESRNNSCSLTPTETDGPFPIKTPAKLLRENIIGNRKGIPLLINFIIQDYTNNCSPLKGASVDIWQCDSQGNYSEYNDQLDGDFTGEHFLRGRQASDVKGNVSFISIYPGSYPGRAPHLHLEVFNKRGQSLLITQIAFPDDISKAVYATEDYKGKYTTSNRRDSAFRNSLKDNLADSITGNLKDGYTLTKVIKVKS